MTNEDEFAPYASKAKKAEAEKIKNNLRSLYLKLESQNGAARSQVSVALELKTDVHLKRLVDNFDLSRATMAEIVEDAGKLMRLNEPDESAAMQEFRSQKQTFEQLLTKVTDAETEIGKAMAEAVRQQPVAAGPPQPGAQRPT